MRVLDFIKAHKIKVRILYWTTFVVFMILIGLPLFFFFYLLDEDRTKQMIIEQFDHQHYKVEVYGRVVPKLWHGLSLELGNVIINSKQNKSLIELNNVSCQLSWLDLLIGRYKVKRFAVNGVDVNENNVFNDGLSNLFNISNNQSSAFSDIKIIDISNIRTVGEDVKYPISNGLLKFERSAGVAAFKAGIKADKTNTFVVFDGIISDISNDILHFSDFRIKGYNKQIVLNAVATASYNLKAQKFIINDLSSKLTLNGYAGGININQIDLSKQGIDITKYDAYLDAYNDFITQHLSMTSDKVFLKDFKELLIGQLNLQYTVAMGNSKVVLDSVFRDFVTDADVWQIKSNNCTNKINYISSKVASNNGLEAVLSGVCKYNLQSMITELELSGSFDRAPAKLGLKISNQKEKPYIKMIGRIDSLDFSRIKLESEKLLPLYNDTSTLPFEWLSLIDMDADLVIKKFALDRISLDNLITKLNIFNDQLNIYKISADIYGGSLYGSAKITKLDKNPGINNTNKNKPVNNALMGLNIGNGYTISTKENLYNLNLQKLLEDLFNISAISGIANLALDVNANSVQSYADLHKKLNGQIIIDAKNGAFKGVDFNLFANPTTIRLPTAPKATIFDRLLAKFDFIDGISHLGNLTFSSPYVIANGSGIINFVDTMLNYNLNIKSALPHNEKNVSSVVIPVVVSGNLLSPKISIQNMHLSNQTLVKTNKTKNHTASKTKAKTKIKKYTFRL